MQSTKNKDMGDRVPKKRCIPQSSPRHDRKGYNSPPEGRPTFLRLFTSNQTDVDWQKGKVHRSNEQLNFPKANDWFQAFPF